MEKSRVVMYRPRVKAQKIYLPKVKVFDRVGSAAKLVEKGVSVSEAARQYGCSRMAIYNRLNGLSKYRYAKAAE